MHDWTSDRPPTSSDDALTIEPRRVLEKVKRFPDHYAMNRHKITTLIPSLDCIYCSPDGNRSVMRSFIYYPFKVSWASMRVYEELERTEKLGKNRRERSKLAQIPTINPICTRHLLGQTGPLPPGSIHHHI